MAKYDAQLQEVKSKLPSAKNILIALPAEANLDEMASGAALFLALQSHGKDVQIVSDKLPQVTQANLYGIGSIKNTVSAPAGGAEVMPGGDYTLVLEGVASPENTVPSLEKLDWFAEAGNLNLVFHTLPGQSFQPSSVHPKGALGGGNFDLIFTIGTPNLLALGNIYSQNQNLFSGYVVNIDNDSTNTNFGQANVLDSNTSSVSEILVDVIPSLNLPFDRDIATNLLAGIFDATANLTNGSVGPDTYTAVGNCVRVGGQKPFSGAQGGQAASSATPVSGFQNPVSASQSAPMMDFSAFMQPPVSASPAAPIIAPAMPSFDVPPQTAKTEETYAVPPVASVLPNEVIPSMSQPTKTTQPQNFQPSAEERPAGERVVTGSPEPGWLTPKVFKGTSVG